MEMGNGARMKFSSLLSTAGELMFTVTAMDHIVLNVQDMPKVLDFYINVLGLARRAY